MDKLEWTVIITALISAFTTLMGKLGFDKWLNKRKLATENELLEFDLADKYRQMNLNLLEQIEQQSHRISELQKQLAEVQAENEKLKAYALNLKQELDQARKQSGKPPQQ